MGTTTDFSNFGWRERRMAMELLEASIEQGFPINFEDNGTTIMFNTHSGFVFFTNEEFQVCMMNGDELEMFNHCGICGLEGFDSEEDWYNDATCEECAEKEGLKEEKEIF